LKKKRTSTKSQSVSISTSKRELRKKTRSFILATFNLTKEKIERPERRTTLLRRKTSLSKVLMHLLERLSISESKLRAKRLTSSTSSEIEI